MNYASHSVFVCYSFSYRKVFINPLAPGSSKLLPDTISTFAHIHLTLTAKLKKIKLEFRSVKL